MVKSKKIFDSPDGKVKLRVQADGSMAELLFSEDSGLINSITVDKLLNEADVVYGFENARNYAEKEGISRKKGEFFPVAIADDTSWEVDVEILIEPLECLLSPRLFSLNDLNRIRFVNAGEKLAKVKTGDSDNTQNKNIFGRMIKDLASDDNFKKSWLGENVEFDTRRNVILAKNDGYTLVENSKKISIINNIFLQQDIIDGDYNIRTGLTLDGSLFNSDLIVAGDLKVLGKIENCNENGIEVNGNVELESAENSMIICSGSFFFNEKLENCRIFANGYVKGQEGSSIRAGKIEAGKFIETGILGSDEGTETKAEISIAPFFKAKMIHLSQKLREKEWNNLEPDNTDPEVKELKELEMKYLKVLPDFLSYNRDEKHIKADSEFLPPLQLRIFQLSRYVESLGEETLFELVPSF